MKRRALLIGIDEYQILSNLKYARRDMAQFGHALIDGCGFDPNYVTMMSCQAEGGLYAFSSYIEDALNDLQQERNLDLLVVGFWGHGFSDSPGTRYLCGIETKEDDLRRTAVSLELIQTRLKQVQARDTLVILDCCQNRPAGRSGSAQPVSTGEELALGSMARDIQAARVDQDPLSVPTVAVLTACREGQKAYEWEQREHGIFTAHLLEAMNSGTNSIAQLASTSFERVVRTAQELHRQRQTPYLTIEGRGDILLAPNINPLQQAPSKPSTAKNKPTHPKPNTSATRPDQNENPSPQSWDHSVLHQCPQCGAKLKIPLALIGKQAKCKKCQMKFSVSLNIEPVPNDPTQLPDEITNSIGMKLRLIPAGEFIMGGTQSNHEQPTHQVRIAQPFYMGIYPVTQREYEEIIGHNPSCFDGEPKRPVESVSWNDAATFCKKLSQNEGRTYRLPTEAEWEYACRAGSTTEFYWGDSTSSKVMDLYCWYKANPDDSTQLVGQKHPNEFGLYDMIGNVLEWCSDHYSRNYYKSSPPEGPCGPDSGSCRVCRGGSWIYGDSFRCRSAYRDSNEPSNANGELGFRVVLPSVPSSSQRE